MNQAAAKAGEAGYSLKEKRILQCYSLKNSKPNDSVLDFINKQWLPFANRKLTKILKVS